MGTRNKLKNITVAHTEDADDAFMFYALTSALLKPKDFEILHVLKPIQQLNEAAKLGVYDMSALSFAAYPAVADKYALMPCGACMGLKQGPMLLARKEIAVQDLDKITIAIPGRLTTAYLVLQMVKSGLKTIQVPFDQIVQAVISGDVDAGLVIHEAQLTYEKSGLTKLLDLGEWWYEATELPLPLGGNVVRRELDAKIAEELIELFQASIQYALSNRAEAASFAMRYARGLTTEEAVRFIGMYVNNLTVDYGLTGRRAVTELFERAYQAGALDRPVKTEFARTSNT